MHNSVASKKTHAYSSTNPHHDNSCDAIWNQLSKGCLSFVVTDKEFPWQRDSGRSIIKPLRPGLKTELINKRLPTFGSRNNYRDNRNEEPADTTVMV
jgi:hypothetical protein